jgi:hypothetical protein
MSNESLLFDRKLLRDRRARFAHEIEEREFLLSHVAREIAERVATLAPITGCSGEGWRRSSP